jgi:hypothetical protein
VLIVSIELKTLSDRKQTARVNFGGAPLLILAFVVHLDAGVWHGVIGADYQRLLDLELIAITPLEHTVAPIEI